MKKRNCPIGAGLVIPASFSECFTYEKQILWLKKAIDSLSGGDHEAITDLQNQINALEQLINDKVSEDVFNQAYNNIINNYVTNDELDERLAGVGEYTIDFDVANYTLSSLYYYTGSTSNTFSSTSIDRIYIKGNEPVYSDGNFWYLHTTVCADLTLVASRTSSYSGANNLSLILRQNNPISDFVYAHDKGYSSLSGNVTSVEGNKTIPLFLPRVNLETATDWIELSNRDIMSYYTAAKRIKYIKGLDLVSGTNTLKYHIESRCVFCKSSPFTIDTVFD